MATLDPNYSPQFGLSGFLDGVANLGLLYGAGAIKSKFPEMAPPQNQNYNQDNAVNQALAAQAAMNKPNWPVIVGLTAVGAIALVALVKR